MRLQPIRQNMDFLRLRGLRLSYVIIERAKPISKKRAWNYVSPQRADIASANAARYGRDFPTSYQGYRVNVYLK